MAYRASETFVVGDTDGKKRYPKDSLVPSHIAKGRAGLVYDDGSSTPKRAKKSTSKQDD